jgi:transglutaminase-like putative cysteine protease
MTVYRVRHQTSYVYDVPVLHAHHLAHLRPRRLDYQTTRRTLLEITPAPRDQHRQEDYFGNDCDVLEVLSPHERFDIIATSEVEVHERPVLARIAEEPFKSRTWTEVAGQLARDARILFAREYCFDSPLVRAHPMLREYAEPSFGEDRPLLDSVLELNDRVHSDFSYEPATTDISTPLAQVMRERRGVCQDFAHVMVGCLRSVGLAARYVSGYLETVPPPGQPRLVGSDASHAWVAAFFPSLGWLDLDPTNGLLPNQSHITVSYGRDFSDVSPLKGVVLGGGRHSVKVGVDVQRLSD